MTTENKQKTASEKAEVMLAFDRGEKVEIRSHGFGNWIHDFYPSWDWQCFDWRVMAKPVECWAWMYADGTLNSTCYDSKDSAERTHCKGRVVLMREVIE